MSNFFDFAPLFRSTIGFDRMLDTLESANRVTSIDTWPPYDIVRTSEDDYRISMAVAGFGEEAAELAEAVLALVEGVSKKPCRAWVAIRHDHFRERSAV